MNKGISLHLISRWLDAGEKEGKPQSVLFRGNKPLTYVEARKFIQELEDEGHISFPSKKIGDKRCG